MPNAGASVSVILAPKAVYDRLNWLASDMSSSVSRLFVAATELDLMLASNCVIVINKQPLCRNTMVHYSPSLLWQGIDFDPSMNEVDSLSGSDEIFEHWVFEEFVLSAAKSKFIAFCVNDVSSQRCRKVRRVNKTLCNLVRR